MRKNLISKILLAILIALVWLLLLSIRDANGKPQEQNIPEPNPYIVAQNHLPGYSFVKDTPRGVESIIYTAAQRQRIDADLFLAIAKCESQLDPEAKNKNSTASGLFQFVKSTWNSTIEELGRLDYDVFNPVHNAEAAAYLYKKDGASHWSASKDCWQNGLQTTRL